LVASVLSESELDQTAVSHLKSTVLANVLFDGIEDPVATFRGGIASLNGCRNETPVQPDSIGAGGSQGFHRAGLGGIAV